jgi:hypothetical protein
MLSERLNVAAGGEPDRQPVDHALPALLATGWRLLRTPRPFGITDLGPSVGYVCASLALFFAAAGATWSVDGVLRQRLGRLGGVISAEPATAVGLEW